jgi:hypothetical protein
MIYKGTAEHQRAKASRVSESGRGEVSGAVLGSQLSRTMALQLASGWTRAGRSARAQMHCRLEPTAVEKRMSARGCVVVGRCSMCDAGGMASSEQVLLPLLVRQLGRQAQDRREPPRTGGRFFTGPWWSAACQTRRADEAGELRSAGREDAGILKRGRGATQKARRKMR